MHAVRGSRHHVGVAAALVHRPTQAVGEVKNPVLVDHARATGPETGAGAGRLDDHVCWTVGQGIADPVDDCHGAEHTNTGPGHDARRRHQSARRERRKAPNGYTCTRSIPHLLPLSARVRPGNIAVCSPPCVPREWSWCLAARSTSCASPALPVVPPPNTPPLVAPGCCVGALTPPWVLRVAVTAARPVRKDPCAHCSARHPGRSRSRCAFDRPHPGVDRLRAGGRPAGSATASHGRAWAGAVGARPSGTAERQRADEEGRRRPARASAHRDALPLHRLRRHRPG